MTDGLIADRPRSRRRRVWLAAPALALAAFFMLGSNPAHAFILIVPAPNFPDSVTVGETFPDAELGIGNFSTPPDDLLSLQFSQINLVPSCDLPVLDCVGGVEVGVFALSATGIGVAGPPSCLGTWTISEITPGTFRFTPPNGEGTLMMVGGDFCLVRYSITTLRVPTIDLGPAPGVQTAQLACATVTNIPVPVRNCGSDQTTVFAAPTNITTQATPAVPLGQPISDTAILGGPPPPAIAPTGSITFTAFGPNDPTCAGIPAFTSAPIPVNGFGAYNSGNFVPIAPGAYNWVASYSGDANYLPVASPCGAPGETSLVVDIFTQVADPSVTLGESISDTATVTGGIAPAPVPTGTVTFTLFGPNDATCAGPPIFTSAAIPLAGGPPPTANSGPFTPTAVGAYRWIASYSGDANYPPLSTICDEPNETTTVIDIATLATASAPVNTPISDTATLTGPAVPPAPAPTGNIVFTLFGPNDAACAGAPVFTSAPVPVNGFGAYPSGNFIPTVPGAYNWIATYSGDANYPGVATACGEPGETTLVVGITTQVADPSVTLGESISDTATVTGGIAPAPVPTGTVTFTLFGPNDAVCAGPPIFTSAPIPLAGGPPPTANSGPFTPTAVGAYRWIASYSGDANYPALSTACNDPNEATTVIDIATLATASAPVNTPISDTATLTGPAVPPAPAPTGNIVFTLFGPNDAACAGAPVFTSAPVPVNGFGAYPSGNFIPTVPGAYNWIATYSGDANYPGVATACGEPGETTLVIDIATQAVPAAPAGAPISDTAILTGPPVPPAPAPGGTITFTLFGPNDPTCAGAPVFTSAAIPVNAFGNYNSGNFVPPTPGSYNWVATYSGDGFYPAIATACGEPGETSTVIDIATQATATAPVNTPITDTAILTGPAVPPAPAPTGSITFTLFGPNDPTCAAAPVFTSAPVPVNGFGNYNSPPFVPTVPGAYNWVASYTGDANYPPIATACGEPGETTLVIDIATLAVPAAPAGAPISDTAILTGPPVPPAPAPGGTITFTLFGPNDATCAAAPVFTSAAIPVNAFGNYNSGDFVPPTPGSYNWVATYSGDGFYPAIATACGEPGETSTVIDIATQATATAPVNTPITDTAILTGPAVPPAPAPTGSITFTLFGPNDPTCAAAPVFTSAAVPVNGFGNYNSPPFVPTVAGAYNWVASYTGDANYPPIATACGEPGETTLVIDIATLAVPAAPAGAPISDTAILTGPPVPPAPAPGGTITFTLFGPNDPTCAAAPVFTSAAIPVNAFGNYNSGDFVPPAPGSYNWVATYSGDGFYPVVATACGEPGETSSVITIQVVKTATPLELPAPGGTFTFDVVVTNPSAEPLTITSLTDNVYGNIATQGTCTTAIGTVLAANGGTYSCSFPGDFFGAARDSQTDVVTVIGENPVGTQVTDDDDAVVTLTGQPAIQIVKTADPLELPAPGGTFTFDLVVTNPSNDTVTITSLTDNVYGDLSTQGTCTTAIGTVLPPVTGTYSCSFPGDFFGAAGDSQTDVATVIGENPVGVQVTDDDDAVVDLFGIPAIQIVKTATPLELPAPGGTFTFDLVVTNPSNDTVTITSLTDNVYGDLSTQGTCTTAIGTVLPPVTGTYSCSFPGDFFGAAGQSQTDVVTVIGENPVGVQVTDDDDAVVTLTGQPAIQIVKTATPLELPAPGGMFTFDLVVTNPSNDAVTITSLIDNVYGNLATQGTCVTALGTVLAPNGGTYSCSFPGDFFGNAGDSQTDVVTVIGENPVGVQVTDDDDAVVTLTGIPAIQIVKTATPLSLPAPGGMFTFDLVVTNPSNDTVTITSLIDNVYGNLATQGTCVTALGTVLAPNGGTYSCSFPGDFFGNAGDSQTDVVTVIGENPVGTQVTDDDDAVVTLTGQPAIQILKSADPSDLPAPGGTFTFDLVITNPSNDAVTITSLTDDVYGDLSTQGTCTTAIGTVLAPGGGTYSCSFPGDFIGDAGDSQVDTVTVIGENPVGVQVTDDDDAVVTLTGEPGIQIVKSADPLTMPAPGGTFVFDLVVTNPSNDTVTITSLTDDVYGDLSTQGTCTTAIGTVLAPGGSYACSFPGDFFGNSGDSQTDVATVIGENPAGEEVTDDDDAVVTLTGQPAIEVVKTADPLSLPAPGGTFIFDVVVTNPSNDTVTITSLTDDVYGNIATQGTCTTAIGTVLGPGDSYSCSFEGDFTGSSGDSQTDIVTVVGENPVGVQVTDDDDAVVTLTGQPAIAVEKSADPLSLPEPGGRFSFDVVVTNTSNENLTITSLTDDVYGNIATQGTCTTAIGTVLAPGESYSCSFEGDFFGNGGDSQTDTVTVVGENPQGQQVTDDDDATVTITDVPPTIEVQKSASPQSLPAPGGAFTFDVVVTNTSNEPLTITSLTDDVYGDLTTRPNSTCNTAIGTILDPGESYSCSFVGEFTGSGGDSQTDVVTVRGIDDEGTSVTDNDDAVVRLTEVPVVPVVQPVTPVIPGVPLVKTGSDVVGPIRVACALVLAGGLLLLVTRRRRRRIDTGLP